MWCVCVGMGAEVKGGEGSVSCVEEGRGWSICPHLVQSKDSHLTLPITQAAVDGPAEVARLVLHRLRRHHHAVPVLVCVVRERLEVMVLGFSGARGWEVFAVAAAPRSLTFVPLSSHFNTTQAQALFPGHLPPLPPPLPNLSALPSSLRLNVRHHHGLQRLGVPRRRPGRALGRLAPGRTPRLPHAAAGEPGRRGDFRYA